ncbi:MAG TPA: hypothetical protein VGL69_08620 [Solirubrobacteraceae bacterium]|jgi:hypothetical protein
MSASRHRRRRIATLRAHAVAAAVIGATALLSSGPSPGTASAAALRNCTPTHGTIVAVDFAHWGGPIVRGCGVAQHSGYALLHAAGFTTAGDEHDGPAVVCRLGDAAFHQGTQYPTPNQQACVQTPPTTGYWAYWTAPRGTNHWAYAPLGAMGDVPKPGEVELWIFGATNVAGTHGTGVPSFSPATLRAHPPARRHTSTTATTQTSTSASTTRTTTTTTPTTTTTTTHATSTPTTTAAITTHTRTSAPAHTHPRRAHLRHAHTAPHHSRHHSAAITHSTSTTRAGATQVVSARPTSRRASSGSSTPLVIGVAIVLLLCAGAGRAIWLRRREE